MGAPGCGSLVGLAQLKLVLYPGWQETEVLVPESNGEEEEHVEEQTCR